MAYDFPLNPTPGQEFVPPMGGQTYVWAAPRWLVKGIPPLVDSSFVGTGIEEAPVDSKQYGRQSGTWTEVFPNPTWATISGKPATFPAEVHVHPQADVVGLTAALNAKEATIALGTTAQFWRGDKTWQVPPPPDWSIITNKPATFAPTGHVHPQSEITNLVTDMAGKAPLVHIHTQSDVTGLVSALASKEPSVTGGTTGQFWRGDKTWQPVPAGDWTAITSKPTTFPPIVHTHVMADITDLQGALNLKSDIGHTHDYGTLMNIPNVFAPSFHTHSMVEITNLQAALDEKAPLASPTFIGTVTLPTTNITSALTGMTAAFSDYVSAVTSIYIKPESSGAQNVNLWFQGPANEDRAVLFTPSAALGSFIIRVGGTQIYEFDTIGILHTPGGVRTNTINATGAISGSTTLTINNTITAGQGITTTNGNVTANDYVVSRAGYFIGSETGVFIGTDTTAGSVYLRPAGYSSSAYQTTINGTTGNLTASGHVISNTSRFIGGPTTAILANNGTSAGTIYLRPNGEASSVGQLTVDSTGFVQVLGNLDTNGSFIYAGNLISSTATAILSVTGTQGTIYFRGVNNTGTEQAYYQYNGNFTIGNQGYKAVAGSWAAGSDARIKNIVGDYEVGLSQIRQLQPKRYTYKGNETMEDEPGMDPADQGRNRKRRQNIVVPYEESAHYRQAINKEIHVSLIAQEAEVAMPEIVTRREAWIDGEKVKDFRVLDPSNITWALINAVKELADRLEILEGKKA